MIARCPSRRSERQWLTAFARRLPPFARFLVSKVSEFEKLQHHEAVRLCLKYFRQRNFTDEFDRLQKRTKISLEAPTLTDLYTALVTSGDFALAEQRFVLYWC